MASLRKRTSSVYWFACFSLPDGRRVQRSTKERRRKEAQKIADDWEQLARSRIQAKHLHKVIADIYKSSQGVDLPSSNVRLFLTSWISQRKGEIKPASYSAYSARIKRFLAWLGDAANEPMAQLSAAIFVKYRDHVASVLTVSTANQSIKVLRSIFEDARRYGYLADNPVKDVRALKGREDKLRSRPFTLDELKAIVKVADKEWRSMILFGLYSGQRLADLARLRWHNIDVAEGELRLQTAKTGRVVIIPLPRPLLDHLKTLEICYNPEAFIHPRAASHVNFETGQAAALSRQFAAVLSAAGLRERLDHKASKSGRDGKHVMAPLSFHCLRHTATSLMKNAGVSPAVVQDIIGHESAEMSAHYTHIENDAKRRALETLPDLTHE